MQPKTIRIMSIGDSITDGANAVGSYRKFLYNNLTKNGYSIKMVGPILSDKFLNFKNEKENFTYEASHCGYNGTTIKTNKERKGIMNILQENDYLKKYNPDVVILMIGTNDIIINEDISTIIRHLKNFIIYIKHNIQKRSSIFVSSIPPLDPNTKFTYNLFESYRKDNNNKTRSKFNVRVIVENKVEDYNREIKKLVNRLKQKMINIYFTDLGSYLPYVEVFCDDGIHPNEVGHKFMGEHLYNQINSILGKFKFK